MPRIDPLQLLKCLSVLLSPEGGILSRDEVPRLVNLMTKFSKKLVSKCVYVLILKNTETSLVDMFMAEGGWTLIQTWLQDAAQSGNWDLVKEILGLLLVTPVDVERLKMNCLPKLIKNLSRREDLGDVAQLSNQIVQNWLIIVKGSAHGSISAVPSVQAGPENRAFEPKPVSADSKEIEESNKLVANSLEPNDEHSEANKDNTTENDQAINPLAFYKVAVKDGKQIIRKLSLEDDQSSNMSDEELNKKEDNSEVKDANSNEKVKEKSKSSASSRGKSSSSSRDKEKEEKKKREKEEKEKKISSKHSSSSKSKSSGGSNSSSSSSSSSSRDKDKDRKSKEKERDRKDRDKDKSKRSSSSKSKSSSSSKDKKESKDKNKRGESKEPKEVKEKQAEKDKDTLEKLKPLTLDKLGRIPKKSDEKQKENKNENKLKETTEKKKPSFSILNRKATGEERTKTVKVFNSKMRSTGLEEEAKPPPPRSAKKPTPSVQLPTIPSKRPSPPREPSSMMPPEKKLKIDIPERPGAIKLIPPKPKPPVLQESDMFMDALTAATPPKKEAKRRKRRLSVSKDIPSSPSSSPVRVDGQTPTSPVPSSPTTAALGLKNIAPINFYQDTLSEEPDKVDDEDKDESITDENKEVSENDTSFEENNELPASPLTPTDDNEVEEDTENMPSPAKQIRLDGGLKGVLLYSKKKGPKKTIKWKAEDDLVEIRYFELDETERVNVTKTFMDMAKMEVTSEREALIMSRKLPSEDVMETQTIWRMLYTCDQPEALAVPGSKSLEKDIQFAREKSVLPALYFDKRRIPDSAEEPIPENHQMSDPVIIPLEDPESQEIDLRSTPWPEPKGPAPQIEPQPMPPMFPNMPFNPNFNAMGNMPPGAQFVGVPPRFPGPPGPHPAMAPGPGNFGPPNMMHNNMMVPPNMVPDIMNSGPMNPNLYVPGPEGFMVPGNDPNYPMQQFNGPQGPNMNMYGPHNFNHRGGGGGRGGGYRRGGGNTGGWVQLNGPRNWKRGGGGGNRGGRMCKNMQNHGYCRNGDNCQFVH